MGHAGGDARFGAATTAEQEETVGIGDVFARAWDLWRRDVGWLILAGLVVGVIITVILAVTYGVFAALIAGAGTAVTADALDDSTSPLSWFGAGLGVAGALVYMVAMFLVQAVTLTFYGGIFEMVIGSYRQQRDVHFGDLFSGFRKFGSYLVYALVLWGVSFGLTLLNFFPLIGGIIALVVSIWIWVIWLYVLPLIADQGLSFMEAAGKSNQMVKSAGWWWTFGMVILLGLAALAILAVVLVLGMLLGRSDGTVGLVVGILLLLVFAVLFPPYAICYISVLYVASGGEYANVPARGGMGTLPPAPPAPSAPPAYGGQGMGRPPSYSMPPQTAAGADAWKAAADPLASPPSSPAPSPAAPSSDQSAMDAAGGMSVTDATPSEPQAPQAPAAPPPPGGGV
jgi:hypothetical protein